MSPVDRMVIRLRDVNPSNTKLSPTEGQMLRALLKQRSDYHCAGRWLEARGVGLAILIVWQSLVRHDGELPDTEMGDL